MADCYCGCGRRISFLARGVNKQMKRTDGLNKKLDVVRDLVQNHRDQITDPDAPEQLFQIASAMGMGYTGGSDQMLRGVQDAMDCLVEDGDIYYRFWRYVAHQDPRERPDECEHLSDQEVKKDWERWGLLGMRAVRTVGIPISRTGAFTGEV